jgi:dihydroxyacetone kinase-like protein
MVNRDNLLAWIDALAQIYSENKQYLTQLDSAIGDADHGINMDRGFQAVKAELEKTNPQDMSAILKTVAMALIRTVGGAAGPLYGTFFMRASSACANKTELGMADVVALFEAGLEGVLLRGKAELNDKTMVDAQKPALEAMKQALADGADLKTMLQKGTTAAEEGMKNTIPLLAKKGRASYLGERSIGHQDPGATSSYLMIKAAADHWT